MAEDQNKSIPIIDFGPFLAATATPADRLTTAQELFRALQVHGFAYLRNHGVTSSAIAGAFAHSARFFAAVTPEDKARLAWSTPAANRGFSRLGQERVSRVEEAADVAALRAANPDIKESFEIGREGEPGCPNQWPATLSHSDDGCEAAAAFKKDMLAFHAVCAALHRALLRALALALALPEHWFDPFVRRGDNTLRLLHYPAVPRATFRSQPGRVRAGAHTDFGSLTLLFQAGAGAGGLEVQGPDRASWVPAPPVDGAIVVNVADLLARWTNGALRSTLHRVVEPPASAETSAEKTEEDGKEEDKAEGEEEMYPPRYSIAYFCNPDFDRVIDVVPGTLAEGESTRFDAVNSGEYLVRRLTATY